MARPHSSPCFSTVACCRSPLVERQSPTWQGEVAYKATGRPGKIMLMECDRARSVSFIPHSYSICFSLERRAANSPFGCCFFRAVFSHCARLEKQKAKQEEDQDKGHNLGCNLWCFSSELQPVAVQKRRGGCVGGELPTAGDPQTKARLSSPKI